MQPCVYEQQRGAAAAPLPRSYRPRQPQTAVLHRVVRENLETFLAQGVQRSATGEGYPLYVEKEFRDFLGCGDLSRGFARCRCAACGHELLLPFSCKNRGLCPSCTARRMSDESAYLVDMVLPEAPYRQWTLTFPFALRFLLARDYRLITAVLCIAVRIIFAWQRRQARREGFRAAKNAAVLFVQRFGGALNGNVHAHALVPDGVFVLDEQRNSFRLVRLSPPSDKDILRLTQRLARRVTTFIERQLTLEPTEDGWLESAIADGMQKVPSLPEPSAEDASDGQPHKVRTSRRSASVDGFSIHADTAVEPHNRLGLEKLCRYGMRPAFSHERLSLSEDGKVLLALRRPWPRPGGLSVLSFEPVAFLRRLAALVPPPWAHLVRHYGLFAPNAKGRDLLPAAPVSPAGMRLQSELRTKRPVPSEPSEPPHASASPPVCTPTPAPTSASTSLATSASSDAAAPRDASPPLRPAQPQRGAGRSRRRVLAWAELLRRVFAIDVLVCPRCGGPMTVIAYLTEATVVQKILTHLDLPASSPPLAPARRLGQLELWDDLGEPAADHHSAPGSLGGRGPPGSPSDSPAHHALDPAADPFDWGA